MRRGMLEARGELRLHCDADCASSLPSLRQHARARAATTTWWSGSRLADGAAARPPPAAPQAHRRPQLPAALPAGPARADPRPLLRLQALARAGGASMPTRAPASRAGPSTPRCSRWRARSGTGIRETGIVWADREGSRVRMARILVPVVRELYAARRHVRREAAPAAPRPRRRAGPARERRRRERAVSASAEAPAAPLSTPPPNRTAPRHRAARPLRGRGPRRPARSCTRAAAGLLVRVWTQGGVVTGGDGFLVADPLQYLTWLREAGEHVAVANLYDLEDGPRSFVHPGVLDLGPAAPARARGRRRVHGLEAGGRARAVRRRARALPALPLRAPATACSRSCSRSSSRRRVAALVGWAGIGGERDEVRLRLHLRRAVGRHLPVGLPVHGRSRSG